ncbi:MULTISPECIES: carbohydrate ABC transporter permease [Paenibacillus]|uniref:Maltose ABC transporter permease n=1 Tax=Paenibacillus borealis TaxID=160799 RepID=A0ABX3HDW9_PAEBO|nr:carbohydrate ABC transporter permease [Paenibacillus borealis]OMD48710.1 maltose ABC transporter permease [Paenibacillus borealis]
MATPKINKWQIALMALIGVVHIVPLYLLVSTAFKKESDLSSKWVLPGYFNLDNFKNAWQYANLDRAFINNIIITFFAVLLILVVGSLASYPLSRFQTRLNKFVYILFISALIVPPLTVLVPLYQFIVDLNGLNTYWGVILLNVTFNLPMTIFLYTGFIGTIPKELDEAGMIDGTSRVGLFFKIILPLLQPVTVTAIILSGVSIWNDYQFSLFFLQTTSMHTLTVALSAFFSQFTSNLSWVAAGSLMSMLPLTLLYLFLQRFFIAGLSAGAVKS